MSDPFILSHIRRLPLFAAFNPEQLDTLAGAFQLLNCAPGQLLYQQGERSSGLYYFVSGTGQLWRYAGGQQRPAGAINPGEYVGEGSLFSGGERDMTAQVTANSTVLALSGDRLAALAAARPDIRALLSLRPEDRQIRQIKQDQKIRDDETVLLSTRRHPWVVLGRVIRAIFIATFVIVIAILLRSLPAASGFAAVVCAGGLLVPTVLGILWVIDWWSDFFNITNQRIIHERRDLSGAVSRDQILLDAVQNVNLVRQGVIADLVGIGTVELGSTGRVNPFTLDRIPNPTGVQKLIFDQVQKRNNSSQLSNTSATPGSGDLGGAFPPMVFVSGDRVVYHKHWLVLSRYIARPIFGIALLIVVLMGVSVIRSRNTALNDLISPLGMFLFAGVWVLLAGWSVLWGYLSWLGDVYIIEREVLIDIKRSPFGLREYRVQASLWQVQNVSSSVRSLVGRIFNYGDVNVLTAAGSGKIDFQDVPNPTGVADEILRRIDQLQRKSPAPRRP